MVIIKANICNAKLHPAWGNGLIPVEDQNKQNEAIVTSFNDILLGGPECALAPSSNPMSPRKPCEDETQFFKKQVTSISPFTTRHVHLEEDQDKMKLNALEGRNYYSWQETEPARLYSDVFQA